MRVVINYKHKISTRDRGESKRSPKGFNYISNLLALLSTVRNPIRIITISFLLITRL